MVLRRVRPRQASSETVNSYPALALLEFNSVASGIKAADAMVKRAPIAEIKVGTVQPGHYLVLIGGSVASVEEAYGAGCEIDEKVILDRVLLPDVHEEVYETALGARNPLVSDALGIFETLTVACLLRAADAATKGAQVGISELRMADDLGGRAFVMFHGLIADVEAALEICRERVEPEQVHGCTILPRLDATLRNALNAETRFVLSKPLEPEGAETHAHR